MVKFVSGRPILPAPPRGLPVEIVSWASSLHRVLTGLLTETNTAVNQLISQEGRPAFAAYLGTNQTGIVSVTWTLVDIDTEDFDTDGAFNTSTSRFTPQTAGTYLFLGALRFVNLADGKYAAAGIRKNAAARKQGGLVSGGAALARGALVVTLFEANGDDDYFTLEANHDAGINEDLSGTAERTWFQGFRIGP